MAKALKQTAAKKAPARKRRAAARTPSAPEEVEVTVKPATPSDAPHRAAQRATAGGGGRRLGGKLVA